MPPTSERLRLAFTNLCADRWVAGCHYLKNLFTALRSLEQPAEIALLHLTPPPDDSHHQLRPLLDHELTYAPVPLAGGARIRASLRYRLLRQSETFEAALARFLRHHGVQALFSMGVLDAPFAVPMMVWIPDFQHVRLPEMFTAEEIARRTQEMQNIGERAERVILSSASARADFATFAPQHVHKAWVLSFVSQLPEAAYTGSPAWVCEQYHLPERYFYLPNQFWKHKNHQVVIDALAHLRQRFPQIVVVCTGNTYDHRTPSHFPQLLAAVSRAGVRENFILLGMVQHEHIFPLMRQALAVLQPSRFEGWSTTVEECKSLGKRVILSDIDTHREQNPPQALFFDPNDPRALAEKLVEVFDQTQPGPDLAMEAAAQAALPGRTRAFGQAFIDIAGQLLASREVLRQ